ncbi:MAG: hypothetical protein R6U21_04125, partial [Thermoplasmatota archaeon]
KKSPLLVWDDAGNWLYAQEHNKKRISDTCKYFQGILKIEKAREKIPKFVCPQYRAIIILLMSKNKE